MESIKELRIICQNTRPAIYSDFLSHIYYKVSIYFTWLCLIFRMSANQVTVLSGIVAIIGGGLLVSDSKFIVLVGIICFHIFCILDMSDGEVARYSKQGGVSGHYLDWFMHFVSSTALMMGLFLASIKVIDSLVLIAIGLLAIVTPILDKCVQNAGWTVICWTRLRDIKNESEGICSQQFIQSSDNEKSHSLVYRRFRFILLSPLQDHWLPTILLIIAILDYVLYLMDIPFFDYMTFLLLYIGIVGPCHIYINVRKMVISNALLSGYRLLICPARKIKLPEDDFLS